MKKRTVISDVISISLNTYRELGPFKGTPIAISQVSMHKVPQCGGAIEITRSGGGHDGNTGNNNRHCRSENVYPARSF